DARNHQLVGEFCFTQLMSFFQFDNKTNLNQKHSDHLQTKALRENGGQGERKRKMERSHKQSDRNKLLLKKAVFVDEETFAKASLCSEQARTIKVLEQRVETLERELDAALQLLLVFVQKNDRLRQQKRLLNYMHRKLQKSSRTPQVFELHMEELRAKQEEIAKRDKEIKLLEAIIQTLGGKESHSRKGIGYVQDTFTIRLTSF
ncbi:hypothetical protein Prudu_021575, partial [Prunus dulcis]